jgi:O-antigen/teichoic acid export membrane protein
MSRLKKNVATNLFGNAWNTLLSLLFVPIYIHYVGIEAWGLIGFFTTLQTLLVLADMGLSTTLNREFAKSTEADNDERRDLLRTLELVYWAVAVVSGAVVIAASPYLATRWLQVHSVSTETARSAIALMGVVTMLQLPLGLYSGGLLGLQRQVRLNVANVIFWTLRSVGSLIVLVLISPTVTAYFIWQLIVSAMHTTAVGIILWRSLGRAPQRAVFRRELLVRIWRFSAGMMAITATATVLTQIDKVILSRILPLETFGYYALASLVAGGLFRIMYPVFVAFFPRLTQMRAANDEEGLKSVYHAGSQLATVMLIPTAAVVALFSKEILLIWTRNPLTAERTYLLVALLITGMAFTGINYIPYALQLAHGWLRLPLYANIAGCVTLVPLLVVLALRYGAIGAAAVSMLFSIASLAIVIGIMHRRILRGEQTRFYIQDVAKPMLAALAVVAIGRLVFPAGAGAVPQAICIGAILACALVAAAMSAPATRDTGLNMIRAVIRRRDPHPS